jgi:DNA (cytosine-5)-methyltransferase 1
MAGRLGRKAMLTVSQALEGLPKCGTKRAAAMNHVAWAHSAKMVERMSVVAEGGQHGDKQRYFSQAYGRLHRRGLARTITTNFPNPGSGRFWHPTEERTLTLREAARIQGFDDSYLFDGYPSHDAVLVGNALDSALAELKFRVIMDTISD